MAMIGEIRSFAGNFVPKGWLPCDGSTHSSNNYAALSYVINQGVNTQTFTLPDLRGRAIIGAGQGRNLSNYVLGQKSGAETLALNSSQLPYHTHGVANNPIPITGYSGINININDSPGNPSQEPSGNFVGKSEIGPVYADTSDGSTLNSGSITIEHNLSINPSSIDISNTGGADALPIVQPVLACNWIINWDGIFPPRN